MSSQPASRQRPYVASAEAQAVADELEFRKIDDVSLSLAEAFRLLRRGFVVGDQLFSSEYGGGYNAGLFLRLYESFPEHFESGVAPIDDDLFDYIIKNIEINKEHMLSLTDEELVEPIRVVTLNDPVPNFVIDGHHRIARLYMEGYRQCYMIRADRLMSHRCLIVKPAPRNE